MKKLKIFSLIFALVTLFTSCEEEAIIGIGKGHVETKEASEITTTSAKLNGEVIRKGGASDYTIGFLLYLGTEEDFTLETDGVQQIQCDKSEGAFAKTIDNLTENKTYKFRAYITNVSGTNYGEVKTFTTKKEIVKGQVTTNIADQITNNSARLNGQIVNTGNSSNYTKGFVLYTGNLSTFTLETSGVTNIVSSTSGNTFNAIANNLTQGKTYKFRAYIKNEAGESYGEVKTFIAKDAVVAGQVTTNDATEITSSQARLNGDLVSSGNSTDYTIGFLLYSGNLSTFTETTSGVQKFEVPNSKSLFNKLVTNLTEQKTYKFRTYITNEAGTSYGDVKTFTTKDVSLRTLTGHNNSVWSASYSPDGTKIVSASPDKTIKIWDANTGTCLQTLTGHTDYVYSASYSPDGTKIVSASDDKTIKIWGLE
jgi:WD40 repeat protein